MTQAQLDSKTAQPLAVKYQETKSLDDFAMLYDACFVWLRRSAVMYFKLQAQDADIAASETLDRIRRLIKSYDSSKSKFYTWSHQVLRNVCYKMFETKNSMVFSNGESEIGVDSLDYSAEQVYREEAPLDPRLERIRDYAKELGGIYSMLIEMFLAGANHQEISRKLHIKSSTITGNSINLLTRYCQVREAGYPSLVCENDRHHVTAYYLSTKLPEQLRMLWIDRKILKKNVGQIAKDHNLDNKTVMTLVNQARKDIIAMNKAFKRQNSIERVAKLKSKQEKHKPLQYDLQDN